MKLKIRADSVEIEGYVNAIERDSKPLTSRTGKFIERIKEGAFKRAIERNRDIHVLVNHDWNRDLGSTANGVLTLEEDSIGLRAHLVTTDPETIKEARDGDLVGWSFGFRDIDVENRTEEGMPLRIVNDMDLREVSIITRKMSPAYKGTLIMARNEDSEEERFVSEPFFDGKMECLTDGDDPEERARAEPEQQLGEEENNQPKPDATIDYSKYEQMIRVMKGEERK